MLKNPFNARIPAEPWFCGDYGNFGSDPGGIQTLDLQNRNLTLYSAKLRDLLKVSGAKVIISFEKCKYSRAYFLIKSQPAATKDSTSKYLFSWRDTSARPFIHQELVDKQRFNSHISYIAYSLHCDYGDFLSYQSTSPFQLARHQTIRYWVIQRNNRTLRIHKISLESSIPSQENEHKKI